MKTLTDTINELNRIFGLLNDRYYDSELELPMITIQKQRGNNLGHFTLRKIWKDKETEECKYEININPINLDRPLVNIVETLHHEMIHYWNTANEIKDCNGNNHNKRFKSAAEERDLICTKEDRVGWGYTSPTEDFIKFVEEEVNPDPECFKYFMNIPKEEKPDKPKNKKTFKYICPTCGMEVKAKPDSNIMCGDCGCKLEIEEE